MTLGLIDINIFYECHYQAIEKRNIKEIGSYLLKAYFTTLRIILSAYSLIYDICHKSFSVNTGQKTYVLELSRTADIYLIITTVQTAI